MKHVKRYRTPLIIPEREMDEHNNNQGILIGLQPGVDCEAGCMSALNNGELEILPPIFQY